MPARPAVAVPCGRGSRQLAGQRRLGSGEREERLTFRRSGRLSDSSTGRTLRWWFPRWADGKVTTFIGTSPRPLSLASLDTESLHVYEDW